MSSSQNFFRRAIFPVCLIAAWFGANGQDLSATVMVDKRRILIGEHFQMTVEVVSGNRQLLVLPDIDTIPHFEILEKSDPQLSGSAIRQSYRLTSFDSGRWVIPAIRISENKFTDTFSVEVVFSDFDPNQPYHDIKDVIGPEPSDRVDLTWWILIAVALLALLVLWIWVRRRKGPAVPKPVDAYREAMDGFEQLQRSDLPTREFYARAVDVFRLYVFRKKGILSLQKTTDDLVLQLSGAGLPKGIFSDLSQALRLADFVKFARYEPAAAERSGTVDTLREAVTWMEESSNQSGDAV